MPLHIPPLGHDDDDDDVAQTWLRREPTLAVSSPGYVVRYAVSIRAQKFLVLVLTATQETVLWRCGDVMVVVDNKENAGWIYPCRAMGVDGC